MENVIFCHQEESNWPMQEGLQLKKKFDDVFESTRYAKALEAFLKAKKDYASKAKDLKAELMEFGAHLQAATDAKRELSVSEESYADCERELESVAERLETNDEKVCGGSH
jgi:DNA repair protein RAD50